MRHGMIELIVVVLILGVLAAISIVDVGHLLNGCRPMAQPPGWTIGQYHLYLAQACVGAH